MKKTVVIAMVLGLVSIAFADSTWVGGTGDWNVDTNWNPVGVPTSSLNALIDAAGSNVTLSGTAGIANRVFMNPGADSTATLNVSTGLTCNAWFSLSRTAQGTANLNVYNGANIVTKGLAVGYNGIGNFTMEGGNVQVGLAAGNVLSFQVAGIPTATIGHAYINGGTLDLTLCGATPLQMAGNPGGATATLDISGGALKLAGNVTNLWNCVTTQYLAGISLTGYNQANNFAYSYDLQSNTTTVTGIVPEPATVALLGFGGLALIRRKRS
jgi:hypothetical protein